MDRLTEKIEEGFYVAPNIPNTDVLKYKLGKLEDIEEEIGCPLDVVFKLIDSYIILDGNPCHVMGILKDGDNLCIHYSTYYGGYDDIEPVSNYGKTFWIDDEVEEWN